MQSALEWQWMWWTGCYRHYVRACSGFRFLRNHSQFWRLCSAWDWLENEGQHKSGETFACFRVSVKWGLDWNRSANQVKADLCCAHLKESLLQNSELKFPLVTEDTHLLSEQSQIGDMGMSQDWQGNLKNGSLLLAGCPLIPRIIFCYSLSDSPVFKEHVLEQKPTGPNTGSTCLFLPGELFPGEQFPWHFT